MSELSLLSDAQMKQFIVNGYVFVEPNLPPEFHESILQQTAEVFEKEGNPGNNLVPRIPELQRFLDSPVVRGAVTSLLGEDFYTQPHRHCHFNQPGSTGQEMHQDGGTRWSHHTRRLLMFYYPQDTPIELGPTGIVPGSQYYATKEGATIVDEFPVIGNAGTTVLVDYDLFHRAMPNTTPRNRFMMKFLFARMSEPRAPSWHTESPEWPGNGDDDHRMFAHLWDWHHGRTSGPDASAASKTSEFVSNAFADLGNETEAARLHAAYALGDEAAAVPELVSRLGDESENVRRHACHALSAIGAPAVDALIDISKNESADVREKAVETLGDIGLPAQPALPALTERLQDEADVVRQHAAESLGTVSQSESTAVPALISALGDSFDKVRLNATLSLAQLGPHAEEATDALRGVLYDENRYVRGNAAHALLRIGTPRSIESVIPFYETSRWCPLTTKESTF